MRERERETRSEATSGLVSTCTRQIPVGDQKQRSPPSLFYSLREVLNGQRRREIWEELGEGQELGGRPAPYCISQGAEGARARGGLGGIGVGAGRPQEGWIHDFEDFLVAILPA